MSKKILLTGANGFLGSNIVAELIQTDYDITPLVRNKSNTSLLPRSVSPFTVDYNDDKQLEDIINKHDIIIHNAAITRANNWEKFYLHNVELTKKLVHFANNSKRLTQFIFISSQAAAGHCIVTPKINPNDKKTLRDIGKKESDACTPTTFYGKSKLLAENYIKENLVKNWTIIRPASVYGPGDRDFFSYFQLVNKGISMVVGSKPKYLSLIYVEDLVKMIVSAVDNKAAFNETFFAADCNIYSWQDFIAELEKIFNKKTIQIKVPHILLYPLAFCGSCIGMFRKKPPVLSLTKMNEITADYWICDNSRAIAKGLYADFKPLSENLTKTLNWYRENKWLK